MEIRLSLTVLMAFILISTRANASQNETRSLNPRSSVSSSVSKTSSVTTNQESEQKSLQLQILADLHQPPARLTYFVLSQILIDYLKQAEDNLVEKKYSGGIWQKSLSFATNLKAGILKWQGHRSYDYQKNKILQLLEFLEKSLDQAQIYKSNPSTDQLIAYFLAQQNSEDAEYYKDLLALEGRLGLLGDAHNVGFEAIKDQESTSRLKNKYLKLISSLQTYFIVNGTFREAAASVLQLFLYSDDSEVRMKTIEALQVLILQPDTDQLQSLINLAKTAVIGGVILKTPAALMGLERLNKLSPLNALKLKWNQLSSMTQASSLALVAHGAALGGVYKDDSRKQKTQTDNLVLNTNNFDTSYKSYQALRLNSQSETKTADLTPSSEYLDVNYSALLKRVEQMEGRWHGWKSAPLLDSMTEILLMGEAGYLKLLATGSIPTDSNTMTAAETTMYVQTAQEAADPLRDIKIIASLREEIRNYFLKRELKELDETALQDLNTILKPYIQYEMSQEFIGVALKYKKANCISQTLIVTMAVFPELLPYLPSSVKLGIQVYADHYQPVLWNEKTQQAFNLVTSSNVPEDMMVNIWKPENLLTSFLLKNNRLSSLNRNSFLVYQAPKSDLIYDSAVIDYVLKKEKSKLNEKVQLRLQERMYDYLGNIDYSQAGLLNRIKTRSLTPFSTDLFSDVKLVRPPAQFPSGSPAYTQQVLEATQTFFQINSKIESETENNKKEIVENSDIQFEDGDLHCKMTTDTDCFYEIDATLGALKTAPTFEIKKIKNGEKYYYTQFWAAMDRTTFPTTVDFAVNHVVQRSMSEFRDRYLSAGNIMRLNVDEQTRIYDWFLYLKTLDYELKNNSLPVFSQFNKRVHERLASLGIYDVVRKFEEFIYLRMGEVLNDASGAKYKAWIQRLNQQPIPDFEVEMRLWFYDFEALKFLKDHNKKAARMMEFLESFKKRQVIRIVELPKDLMLENSANEEPTTSSNAHSSVKSPHTNSMLTSMAPAGMQVYIIDSHQTPSLWKNKPLDIKILSARLPLFWLFYFLDSGDSTSDSRLFSLRYMNAARFIPLNDYLNLNTGFMSNDSFVFSLGHVSKSCHESGMRIDMAIEGGDRIGDLDSSKMSPAEYKKAIEQLRKHLKSICDTYDMDFYHNFVF